MKKLMVGDYKVTVEIAELAEGINMTMRGEPDFNGLFLGQYTGQDSHEYDLYYIPSEDTFLAYDIHPEKNVGDQYDLGDYASLPVFNATNPTHLLSEWSNYGPIVAFKRWMSLQPKVELQEPEVGMTFKWVSPWHAEDQDVVHIITHIHLPPQGWAERYTDIWGVRRQPDGKFLDSISDNTAGIDIDDFRFHQQAGRIIIQEETVDVPDPDDSECSSAWMDSLDWAPGNSPAEREAEYKKMFPGAFAPENDE